MWFADSHADIGGGWERQGDTHLVSDIPLEWMLKETEALPPRPSHLAISEKEKSNNDDFTPPHDMLASDSGTSRLGALG